MMIFFEGKFDRPLLRYRLMLANLIVMGAIFVVGFVLILLDNHNDLGRLLLALSSSLNLINFYLIRKMFFQTIEMRSENGNLLLVSKGRTIRKIALPICANTDLSLEPMRFGHKLVKRLIIQSPITSEYIIISELTDKNDGSAINERIRYSDYLAVDSNVVDGILHKLSEQGMLLEEKK